ncbi:hypothetical protein [Laspinema olomoucense]|uniref:Secreted protein n=1 Tax=Laspinema olomoucense D3b TaxID=2953688 RepID=A0ABT2N6V7_9CYAN|nr:MULTISPECIES: hypothetical protein [unclassified Laspinema]MCT7974023.1 hypothetical protein [Laspinema sp. D3d]MCT7978429.1 hypothetical protein [Laspinema sp. D3b]
MKLKISRYLILTAALGSVCLGAAAPAIGLDPASGCLPTELDPPSDSDTDSDSDTEDTETVSFR